MRRIWQYLIVFLIVMFGSAGYTIVSFTPTSSLINNPASTNATPIFDSTLSKLMATSNADASFDLSVEGDGINVSANGSVQVKTTDSGVDFNFVLDAVINDMPVNVNLILKDQIVYLHTGNIHLKFTTNELVTDMGGVMEMLTPVLAEFGLGGLDLAALDINAILGMLDVNEQALEDESGYQVNLGVMGIVNVVIITDNNYAPKEIKIENLNISGVEVNFNATTDLVSEIEEIELNEDSQKALDVTHSTALVDLIMGRLDQRQFEVNFNATAFEQTVAGTLKLDANTLQGQAEIEALNQTVNLWFDKNNIFAELLGIKVKANTSKVVELIGGLSALSGIDLSNINLNTDALSNLDLNAIDLSFINSIENTENGVLVKIADAEILFFENENNTLGGLEFKGYGITANVQIVDGKEFVLSAPQGDFCDIESITPFVEKVKQIASAKTFSLDATLSVDKISVGANIMLDTKNSLVKLQTMVLGEPLEIIANKTECYITYYNNVFKANYSNLANSVKTLLTTFGVNVENTDVTQILTDDMLKLIDDAKLVLEQIKAGNYSVILGAAASFDGFEKFCFCNNVLWIKVFGAEVKLDITQNPTLSVNYGNISLTASLTTPLEEITLPKNATVIEDVVNVIAAKITKYNKQTFNFDAEIEVENNKFSANIQLDFSNGINAKLTTEILNEPFEIVYLNNVIYLSVDGLKVYISAKDLGNILAVVGGALNVDQQIADLSKDYPQINQILSIVEQFKQQGVLDAFAGILASFEGKFDVNSILNANISSYVENFVVNENEISASLSCGISAGVKFGTTDQLFVNGILNETEFNVTLTENLNDVEISVNQNSYNSIVELVPFVNFAKQIAESKQLSTLVTIKLDDFALDANLNLDFNNGLKAQLSTQILGLPLYVWFENNTVYVELDKTLISCNISETNQLMESLKQIIGLIGVANNISTDSLNSVISPVITWANNLFEKLLNYQNALDELDVLLWTDNAFVAVIFDIEFRAKFVNNTVDEVDIKTTIPNFATIKVLLQDVKASASFENYNKTQFVPAQNIVNSLSGVVSQVVGKKFDVLATVNYGGAEYVANVQLDLTNGTKIKATTSLMGYDVQVVVIENDVYINIDNLLKVSVNIANVNDMLTKVEEFGLDLDMVKAIISTVYEYKTNFETSLNNGTLLEFITSFMPETNLDISALGAIFTVTVDGITLTDTMLEFAMQDIYAKATFENGIKTLDAKVNDITANILFNSSDFEITVNKNFYNEIEDLSGMLEFVNKIYTNKQVSANVSVSVDNITFNADVKLDFNNGIKAQVNTTLLGLSTTIWFENNTVYVVLGEAKISCDINNIEQLISDVTAIITKLGLVAESTETTGSANGTNLTESEQIKPIITWATNLLAKLQDMDNLVNNIEEITFDENAINITVAGIKLAITLSNGAGNVEVNVAVDGLGDVKVTVANIVSSATFTSYTASEFVTETELVTLLNNLADKINSKKVAFKATVNAGAEYVANVWLDLNNGVALKVTTELMGYSLEVVLLENVVYITVDNRIKLSADITEVNGLLTQLEGFGIDLSAVKEIITQALGYKADFESSLTNGTLIEFITQFMPTDTNIEFNPAMILGISIDKLVLNHTTIEFAMSDIYAKVVYGDSIESIQATYGEYAGLIEIDETDFTIEIAEESSYSSAGNLNNTINFASGVYNSKQISANLIVAVDNITFNADVKLDFNNGIKAQVNTTLLGLSTTIWFENNTVYVVLGEAKISCDINNIEQLISDVTAIITKLGLVAESTETTGSANGTNLTESEQIKPIITWATNLLAKLQDMDNLVNNIEEITFDENAINITVAGIKLAITLSNGAGNVEVNVAVDGLGDVKVTVANITNTATFTTYTASEFVTETELVTLLNNLADKINSKKVAFKATVNAGAEYVANVWLDLNNGISLKATTCLMGYNLEVVLLENVVYITVDNRIKLSADVTEVNGLLTQLEGFGIDLSSVKEIITQALDYKTDFENSLTNGTLIEFITKFMPTDTNIEFNPAMILGISIDKLVLNHTTIEFAMGDIYAKVVYGESIESIQATYGEYAGLIEIDETDFVIEVAEESSFSSAGNLNNTINFASGVYNSKQISANLTVAVDNITFNADVKLDFNNGIKAQVNTTLLGLSTTIWFENNTVYVVLGEAKISCDINNIEQLISDVTAIITKLGLVAESTETTGSANGTNLTESDQIKPIITWATDLLAKLQNYENIINEVTVLSWNSNELVVTVAGVSFNVTVNNNIASVVVGADVNGLGNATITVANITNAATFTTYTASEFVTAENLLTLLDSIATQVESKKFELVVTLNLDGTDYTANVLLDLTNGIEKVKAIINTEIMGFNISAKYIENIIYIDVNGFKLYESVDNISSVVEEFTRIFGIEMNSDATNDLMATINSATLESALNSLAINLITNTNSLTINLNNILGLKEQLGVENFIDVVINHENYAFTSLDVTFDSYVAQIKFGANNVNIETPAEGEYKLAINNLVPLVESLKNTLENFSIMGDIDLAFEYAGETNLLDIDYGIKLADNNLSLYIETEFKGISVNVVIDNNVIYIDASGLKLQIPFEQIGEIITWLNTDFGLGLPEVDMSGVNTNVSLDLSSIAEMDLGILNDIMFADGMVDATILENLNIVVEFAEKINKVTFTQGTTNAIINCINFKPFTLPELVGEYNTYTIIKDAIDSALTTFNSKQFNLQASVDVFDNTSKKFNGNIGLQIDFVGALLMNGAGTVVDVTSGDSYNMSIGFENDYLFVNYEGMRLKAKQQTLKELLYIGLDVLGIDPDTIPWLNTVGDDMNINTDNLKNVIPELDLGNPLNMLSMIRSINIENGNFIIVLKGSSVSTAQNPKDMTVTLELNEGKLSAISLTNIYTGVANGEYFNLGIEFATFAGVPSVAEADKYIDLSGSSDLLKAFVNSSTLNDFHIQGKINLKLLGMEGLVTLDVDARIKVAESGDITAAVTLSNYPLIGLVNGSNTNGVGMVGFAERFRTITIYYKDGYFYLKTFDEEWGLYKEYTRITKINPKVFLDNMEYYVQWLLGFTDTIQNAIIEAIEESRNYTGETDLGNIILGYSVVSGRHEIQLNLGEITHSSDIGTLKLGLTVQNIPVTDAEGNTVTKEYLYGLDIWLNMLGDVIILETDDNNKLYLINVGQPVDLSAMNNYVNSYAYNEDGEYEKKGSDSFSQTNANNVTITFNNNGGTSSTASITGKIASNLTLPTPTRVDDDGVTRTTYSFAGWYDENGNEFTRTSYPRSSVTLTAKWEVVEVKNYYTLTYVNNNGTSNTVKNVLEGSAISVASLNTYVVDDGVTEKTYTFAGWYAGETLWNSTVMPAENLTLTAKWNKNVKHYYTLTYVNNNGTANTVKNVLEGSAISVAGLETYVVDNAVTKTTYTFAGWYVGETLWNSTVMPTENLTLTAKWNDNVEYYRTATFIDGDTVVKTVNKLEGSVVELITLEPYKTKVGDTQTTYTFAGWFTTSELQTQVTENITLGKTNVVVYAKWNSESFTVKTLTIYDNNVQVYSGDHIVGTAIVLPISTDSNTKWYYDAGYQNEYGVLNTMPNEHLTLHIRNAYTLTVYSQYGLNGSNTTEYNASYLVYQGENVESKIPTISSYVIDNYGVKKSTFTFIGYVDLISTMPNNNTTVTASWTTKTENYYTVTFKTDWYKQSDRVLEGSIQKEATPPATQVLLEGSNLSLTQFAPTITVGFWKVFYTESCVFKATSWSESSGGNGTKLTSISNIQKNYVLYAVWQEQ